MIRPLALWLALTLALALGMPLAWAIDRWLCATPACLEME